LASWQLRYNEKYSFVHLQFFHVMLLSVDRKIILASASPRRAQLLRQIGLDFSIEPAHLDEDNIQEKIISPEEVTRTLSREKAATVAQGIERGLIIGADTVVCLENNILNKPAGETEAMQILSALSNRRHQVITGVTLLLKPEQRQLTFTEITQVAFRNLSNDEIRSYIATNEPWDKAGGYGIQGQGALLVHSIEGDYNNVVGFPLTRFYQEVQQLMRDVS